MSLLSSAVPYFIFFLAVAEQKLLGRKIDDQRAEESSEPEFILFI